MVPSHLEPATPGPGKPMLIRLSSVRCAIIVVRRDPWPTLLKHNTEQREQHALISCCDFYAQHEHVY
jgi:hypothetical protein